MDYNKSIRKKIKKHLINDLGFFPEIADDIIQEVRFEILDYLDGKDDYFSIEQIMQEFLELDETYLPGIIMLD